MTCPGDGADNREFLLSFSRRAARLRVPLLGSIELTRRCNLRCRHCYLGGEGAGREDGGLSTGRLLGLIDEIADAGCLYLLFSGGEPLLHRDFPRVYRLAREKGMIVTVFTNGTTVTPEVLDLFREVPPRVVEVSLYGATAATCDGITGVAGSFERCLAGIEALSGRGVPVMLKTVLMTANRRELPLMAAMAGERGLKFRFDAVLFPRWSGDRAPLELRVPAGEAVALEFADPERAARWREYHRRTAGQEIPDRLFTCGAGTTGFHVDADGVLRPCLMARQMGRRLAGGDFAAAWAALSASVAGDAGHAGPGKDDRCRRCEHHFLCGYCPGHFALEEGAEDRRVEYLCELGKHRSRRIAL